MKRIYIFPALLALCWNIGFSQDNSKNYIRTRVMLDENASNYLETVQYYDGLGRPYLNVQKNITPSGANLSTLQEYDGLGRESKTYLPYENSLEYLSPQDIKKNISVTYGGDSRPFSESVYEASPLNRVTKVYGPGGAWSAHPVSTDYETNTTSGVLVCKLYKVSSTGSLMQNGNYDSGTLYVNKVTDEDGNITYSFVDMLGQTVLTRQMADGVTYDTYYVYDDFGNLRFVLPPAYQDTPDLSLYGYRYKYDARNRCIEKTLPGCQPIYYVYDRSDNLALSQDGEQRTRQEWSFTLYDALNRGVVTGTVRTPNSREQLADRYKDALFHASYNNTCPSDLEKADNMFGYATSALSGFSVKVFSVNYYDRYDFLSLGPFLNNNAGYVEDTSFGIRHSSSQGLLTGAYIRQLDDLGKGEFVAHYYDIQGREIQKRSRLLPDGHNDYTWTKYNFTGQPLCVKYDHFSAYDIGKIHILGDPKANSQFELYEYEYDHAGRLVKTYHTHNSGERILLSESIYDNLGRLKEKKRHNGMDTVRYEYNIRNWVTSIKSLSFVQKLYYEAGAGSGFVPRYNGNIAGIGYEQKGNAYNYLFLYDGLNRLSAAKSFDSHGNEIPYSEWYEYDKMGNITYLKRKLGENKVDALDILYNGNQIRNISTRSPFIAKRYGDVSYVDLAKTKTEYFYDNNGNLIKNLDKGIVSTRHNLLNLPDTIQFQNGNQIINSYLADGRKVRSVYKTYMTGIVVPQDSVYHGDDYCDTSIDEWDGHYTYRNWYGLDMSMFMVQTPEGYVGTDRVGLQLRREYVYSYYVHDHLGNVRITRNSKGHYSDQSLEYYPSGVLFDRSSQIGRQPYMFGGKEFVSMHGLNEYDFTGRWQDPVIPRFTSIDPLCEKYYSVSPYAYCANNFVNAFDLNGDSIWYTIDNKVVTMHVTGKVINNSSDNINMNRAASDIALGITEAFTGTFEIDGESYVLQTDIQLNAVNSMDDVADSDHLFVFLDADGESARGAVNMLGGKVINVAACDYANDNWFSNTFFSNETRTATHEFGHAAGLTHDIAIGPRNLMKPGKYGTNVTSKQRALMLSSQKNINKNSNFIVYDKKYPYPYVHDSQTRTVYPAKMLLNWNKRRNKR